MRYKIVCIRDRAADAFSVPQFTSSIGGAIRGFTDEINSNKDGSALSGHPEDFDLYELGEFDDSDGMFYAAGPRMVAIGKDLVK